MCLHIAAAYRAKAYLHLACTFVAFDERPPLFCGAPYPLRYCGDAVSSWDGVGRPWESRKGAAQGRSSTCIYLPRQLSDLQNKTHH